MQDLHFIFSALLSLFSVFHFSSGNSFEGNVFIIIFEIPQLEASTVHHVLKWQDNRMEKCSMPSVCVMVCHGDGGVLTWCRCWPVVTQCVTPQQSNQMWWGWCLCSLYPSWPWWPGAQCAQYVGAGIWGRGKGPDTRHQPGTSIQQWRCQQNFVMNSAVFENVPTSLFSLFKHGEST